VVRDHALDLSTDVETIDRMHFEPIQKILRGSEAGLFMIPRSNSSIDASCGRRLTEIMANRSEHDSELTWARQSFDTTTGFVDDE
jgi:hypothetical protein